MKNKIKTSQRIARAALTSRGKRALARKVSAAQKAEDTLTGKQKKEAKEWIKREFEAFAEKQADAAKTFEEKLNTKCRKNYNDAAIWHILGEKSYNAFVYRTMANALKKKIK